MNTFKARSAALAFGLLAALSLGVASADSSAKDSRQVTREASIPFADHGGIYDWKADGDKGLWVQSNHRQWYYATFTSDCTGLNFANSLGFDTRPIGTFDRFSAIIVPRWGRCVVKSFEPSLGPVDEEEKG